MSGVSRDRSSFHDEKAEIAIRNPAYAQLIREELQFILAAPSFRSSKRCSEFLCFVVERTLEGRHDELKERILGVSLFGRAPDYDTPGDPVVRVKANEVRKRLAQYYNDQGRDRTIRIDLPPGSYQPEFRHADSPPVPEAHLLPSESGPRLRAHLAASRRIVLWAALAILVVLAGFGLARVRRPSALDAFWNPVFRSDRTPILCVGPSGQVWLLADRLSAELERMQAQAANPTDVQIGPREAIPAGNTYFSLGTAKSAIGLSLFFLSKGSRAQLRMGVPLTLDDFRNHSVVSVGAFSNPWTLERNAEMRFRFDRGTSGGKLWLGISDSQDPKNHWRVQEAPFNTLSVDFALITRVFDRVSNTVFVSLAGLNQYGTEAAAEFVTDPRYLSDLARHAPPGWQSKNLQVVIETSIVEARPTPPQVVKVYFW